MKKFLTICYLLFAICYLMALPSNVQATSLPPARGSSTIEAVIGEYYLSVSGYIAPYASVVLSTNGKVMRSTVADAYGNFYISQVFINIGFSNFCLDSVDFKRLGESEACFTVPPANGNITKQKLFLPPTIGLYRNQITAGSKALIFGYSMPGAAVTITLNTGQTFTTTADSTGYYQISATIQQAGDYQLFANATYKGNKSEKPAKGVVLHALGAAQQIGNAIGNWWNNLLKILTGLPLGPLWLGLPILILIFILLRKLFKQGSLAPKPAQPTKLHFVFDQLFKSKKLHHFWMEGVGY